MLLLNCPHCGPRAEMEFVYVRAAESAPTINAEDTERFARLYLRTNPCGPAREIWQHTSGCRAHLLIERNTLTHDVYSVAIVAGEVQ